MTKMWQPSNSTINSSQLTVFTKYIEEKFNCQFDDYKALWQWSIDNKELFWLSIWQFFSVIHQSPPTTIFKSNGSEFYQNTWFNGAKLSFAENLLKNKSENIALCFINETGTKTSLSYLQLNNLCGRLANAMRENGIKKGDRIAGIMPNCLETVIAMLATTSIGAIWSSCSPDFGFQGCMDRFEQIQPKLIFSVDGYQYNGKSHQCLDKVHKLLNNISSIEQLIIIPFNSNELSVSDYKQTILFNDYLSNNDSLIFESVPFNHPLYIMFSSGTTGSPKCIVHSVGGTLLQHLKELALHSNISNKDKVFFFTTCGWMMWNWMISSLALSAEVILYDGCPTYKKPDLLLEIVAKQHVTVFGCGAKYLDSIEKAGSCPIKNYDFKALKTILSTGSALSPHSFDFVYKDIKSDLQLSSISGGTDIISCFALGNPNTPVYRGELQCAGLGMDVQIFDENANSVKNQKGELVCCSPFPSMPMYFWNDPENKKYHNAYFDRFKNCWAQGDYAKLTQNNGLIIYGRSDSILNPGGVRIGTAEIYRQVEKVKQVIDSVVIGQKWHDDERIILFVQLKAKFQLTDDLIKIIKQQIRKNTTPRHMPAKVIQVSAIPRTISGKVVEVAVKKTVHGEKINNIEAIANPEALEQFKIENW